MFNISRLTRFLLAFILIVSASYSNAQRYSATKASDLYPQIKKTLDNIKDDKNADEYVWIVSLFAAYNYNVRGDNFFDSFNGKTPKNLISSHKSLVAAVESRLSSNDFSVSRSARLIIDKAHDIERKILNKYIGEICKEKIGQIDFEVESFNFWGDNPNIKMKIANNSSWDISCVYVLLSYENKNRRNPWGQAVIKLDFPSVLEAGESRSMYYTLPYENPLCKIPYNADGDLYFKITGITNLSGKTVLADETFTDPFDI